MVLNIYGMYVYVSVCLCTYMCFVFFFLGFFLYGFVLPYSGLFVFISSYFFYIPVCFLMREQKKNKSVGLGGGKVQRIWEELGKCDQNIFHEKKNLLERQEKKRKKKKSFLRVPSVMTLLSLAHTEAVLLWVLITGFLGSESHVPAFSTHCIEGSSAPVCSLYRTETGIVDATVNKWISWNELRSAFLGATL